MKKLQFVIWIIIMVAILALIGVYGYFTYLRITSTVQHPEATFEIENYGKVVVELYPEYAPNTVTNFIKLVEKGYYNNKVFYGKDEICMYLGRNSTGEIEETKLSLISDEVEPDSESDYEYAIKGEFVANGFEQNTLRHEKGILTLIRNDYSQLINSLTDESYNSGSSQLAIMMSDDSRNLNGAYAAFGRVKEGMDVLEKIYNEAEIKQESAEGEESNVADNISQFATYPVITSATVDTHGIDFGDPEVIEAFDYESYMYNLMNSTYSN